MSKSALVLLCLAVAVLQTFIWRAAEVRDSMAQHMAQVAQSCQGKVTLAEGKLLEGKSRYVVGYEFAAATGNFAGEEYFSLRQSQAELPHKGETITVFYDPADPKWNTLTDPRLIVDRVANFKLLTLAFGAFTYAFIYVIWRGDTKSSGNKP